MNVDIIFLKKKTFIINFSGLEMRIMKIELEMRKFYCVWVEQWDLDFFRVKFESFVI